MHFSDLLNIRLSRRGFLKSTALTAAALHLPHTAVANTTRPAQSDVPIPADGYAYQTLVSWEDIITKDGQTFGTNCDYTAFFPIDDNPKHGLLCVNNEYPSPKLMFEQPDASAEQTRVEMASVGVSIVEIKQVDNKWQVIANGQYNRRINALDSICTFSGAAAEKLPAAAIGTLGNCGGGITPWGTYLTCEENFNYYFSGTPSDDDKLYGVGKPKIDHWGKHDPRFNLDDMPDAALNFGWVVEIDSFKPDSQPVKHTALGRFKHEYATCVTKGNALVVYMGDDEADQFLYKFVSENGNLTDGILYTAKLYENGKLDWIALTHGENDLNAENGFADQADILLFTRKAASFVGATPMDRPEGIVADKNGTLYISLTKNPDRAEKHAANPRINNKFGHIITINTKNNHTHTRVSWDIFMLAGNPQVPEHGALYPEVTSDWLANPDNLAIDPNGHLWIATDGAKKSAGIADALYKMEEGIPKLICQMPFGAEATGISFTPDNETIFLSVQHPAEGSDLNNPSTKWPHGDKPRSSVIALHKL